MGNAAPYYEQGLVHFRDGNYDGAIEAYSFAVYYDPRDAVTFKDRGDARLEKGDLLGAIADFSQAVELDPLFARAFSRRAHAKIRTGDLASALADCDKALKLDLGEVQAYSARALARARRGDEKGALADADLAVDLDPFCAQAMSCRGYARFLQGDREGASADCRAALRRNPRNLRARTTLELMDSAAEVNHSGPEVDPETMLMLGSSIASLEPLVATKDCGVAKVQAEIYLEASGSAWFWCVCETEPDETRIPAEVAACGDEALPDLRFLEPAVAHPAREANAP